jgi:hypothetical protein
VDSAKSPARKRCEADAVSQYNQNHGAAIGDSLILGVKVGGGIIGGGALIGCGLGGTAGFLFGAVGIATAPAAGLAGCLSVGGSFAEAMIVPGILIGGIVGARNYSIAEIEAQQKRNKKMEQCSLLQ